MSLAAGATFDDAVQKVPEKVISDHGRRLFNGEGYSEDWQVEAEVIELFEHYRVFSEREMHSRYEIAVEQYVLSVAVEARSTLVIAMTAILPASTRYQPELATNSASMVAIGDDCDAATLDSVCGSNRARQSGIAGVAEVLAAAHDVASEDEAAYACSRLLPAMVAVRNAADALERVVADDLWPLPTYQAMLSNL